MISPSVAGHRAIHIDVLGVRLRLESGDGADQVAHDWAWCRSEPPDGEVVAVAGHSARALETAVTKEAISQAVGRLHLWHAAGVASADGRVLILVAPSGTGKSTAAVHLSRSGWGYVTDETVGVTLDGRVLPYPKPVAIVSSVPDGPPLAGVKHIMSPDDLGLGRPPKALVVGRIVVLDRSETASSPTLSRMPLLEGLEAVIAQSSGLVELPEPLLSTCRIIRRAGGVYRLSYADISTATDLLDELLLRDPEPPQQWIHRAADVNDNDSGVPNADVVARAPWLDAIRSDGDWLVLVGSVALRLRGLGATIWEALDHVRTEAELVTLVRRAHGSHPDAAALVGRAVEDMAAAGVVVRTALSVVGGP